MDPHRASWTKVCTISWWNPRDVKGLDQKHLTATDFQLIKSIRENLSSHHDMIIDLGYTARILEAHIEEIINSVIIGIIMKRVVFLKEFMKGLNQFGVADAIKSRPEAFKSLFTREAQS